VKVEALDETLAVKELQVVLPEALRAAEEDVLGGRKSVRIVQLRALCCEEDYVV